MFSIYPWHFAFYPISRGRQLGQSGEQCRHLANHPLKMSFENGKSRFLDIYVSPEVQNIPRFFHAAIWSQKKVVLQKQKCNAWLDQPRTGMCFWVFADQNILS